MRTQPRSSRASRWYSSWRLALRMCLREIARSRGRTGATWLMVAIPITAICAVQVVLASADLSAAEQLSLRLGAAEAVLSRTDRAFVPSFDGVGSAVYPGEGTGAAAKIPGWGKDLEAHKSALGRVMGRSVTVATLSDAKVEHGLSPVLNLGLDYRAGETAYPLTLISGRLPHGAGEALTTPNGIEAGIPADGMVAVRRGSQAQSITVRIVGTARVSIDEAVGLLTFPDVSATAVRYLVSGDPVTWSEAGLLATYGFETSSRGILQSPPDRRIVQAEASRLFYTSLIAAAALLEVALIIGPAFAIGADVRRRQLSLLAMNGATPTQLRRVGVGEGLVIGVTAALAGSVVGTALGICVSIVVASSGSLHGPLEIPLASLAMVLGLGVMTPVCVALVTSRGLSRLDLVTGSDVPQPARAQRFSSLRFSSVFLIGGFALVWVAPRVTVNAGAWVFWLWTAGTLGVVIGALLVVPHLLNRLGQLSADAPLVVRMSARQAARQHGRSSATLAAVLAGGMVLSVVWTIVLSFDANASRNYRPSVPLGQATVEMPDDRAATALIRSVRGQGGIDAVEFAMVTGWSLSASADDAGTIAAVPTGCDPADVIADEPPPGCASLSTGSRQMGAGILAGSLKDLTSTFSLGMQEQAVLASGGILVNTDDHVGDSRWSQNRIDAGSLSLYHYSGDGETTPRNVILTAAAVDSATLSRGAAPQRYGALISSQTATRLGWISGARWLQVFHHGSAIQSDEEAALARIVRSGDPGATLQVERGYSPQPQPLLWAATAAAVLLAVVAAAMSALLSMAQLRPYFETLNALGASPNTARRLAATQSAYLALLGTVIGCLVGVGVAAPLVVAVTGGRGASPIQPTLVVPWAVIVALVILIPSGSAITATLSSMSAAPAANSGAGRVVRRPRG